ncbi:hypothetical protein AVEN_123683-1 [Araneus ventricosus]|uniref:Uncharacterized protein n=1 Tax=Araneus ventricosus TaxID=182803 RepID=A0A4Y2DFI9_ARAVE|nr:hypothetical protein AVEN_123683-1 [Araneus ventricosus]
MVGMGLGWAMDLGWVELVVGQWLGFGGDELMGGGLEILREVIWTRVAVLQLRLGSCHTTCRLDCRAALVRFCSVVYAAFIRFDWFWLPRHLRATLQFALLPF